MSPEEVLKTYDNMSKFFADRKEQDEKKKKEEASKKKANEPLRFTGGQVFLILMAFGLPVGGGTYLAMHQMFKMILETLK